MRGKRTRFIAECFAFAFSTIIFFMAVTGCTSTETVPYEVFGEMSVSYEEGNRTLKTDYVFTNLADKTVEAFTLVLYAFDEDGSSPFYGKNNLVFEVLQTVYEHETAFGSIDLNDYLSFVPEEAYELEYIYASRICYDDNSVWTDAFGTEYLQR